MIMLRLLPLLALGLVCYLLYRRFDKLPDDQRKLWLIRLAIGAFLGLVLFALLTGRLNWIGALLMGLIPFLSTTWRWLNRAKGLAQLWQSLRTPRHPFQTTGLVLNDAANEGELKSGPYRGQKLSALNQGQLDEVLQYFNGNDNAAANLLRLYLVKRFGTQWQGTAFDQGNQSNMSAMEARALLGLDENADKQSIISAHRKLIQKFHPDRGGNDYLAARINLAKDILLKQLPNN